MGEHWFASASGGYNNSRETKHVAAPPNNKVVGGGSLGFKTYQHTLTASYTRSSTDSYGLIGTVTSVGGSWGWHHPGSDWALSASYSEEQTRNTGFIRLSGWLASGGITRKLNDRSTMTAQYVYLDGSSIFTDTPTRFTVHSVRVSIGWSPQPNLR